MGHFKIWNYNNNVVDEFWDFCIFYHVKTNHRSVSLLEYWYWATTYATGSRVYGGASLGYVVRLWSRATTYVIRQLVDFVLTLLVTTKRQKPQAE